MAREVISWCDRHLHLHAEHVVGNEIRVGLNGQWFSADLCEPCAKELLAPAAQLLADHGKAIVRDGAPAAKAALKAGKASAAKNTGSGFEAPNVQPSKQQVSLHYVNLERRRSGTRLGRKPGVGSDDHAPCIFCGIDFRDGGNASHMAVHGFTTMGAALGGHCPYCGENFGSLGNHLRRAHSERMQKGTFVLARELLQAHLNGAPYDALPALRARALNVEPLDQVLRSLVNA